MPESAGEGRRWTSITQFPLRRAYNGSLAEIIEIIESDAGLGGLVHPSDRGGNQDLYHHIGVTRQRPKSGYRGRGADTEMVPGAWSDLDVKGGSFGSWGDIYNVIADMDRLGIGPQGVVMTGSGGAHCYWRAENGLDPAAGGMYTKRIRRWIQAEYGVTVDNVADPARIMRLPGSIRFPKNGDPVGTEPVLVAMTRIEPIYTDLKVLEAVTQDAWAAVEDRTREQRDRLAADFYALESLALTEFEVQGVLPGADGIDLGGFFPGGESDDLGWDDLWGRYAFLEVFNASVPWAAVLEPAGWTKYGDPDDQGRQSWTRPGGGTKNPRSAITDWELGPNVMSLLSDAEETGLSHLHDLADDATRRVFKLTKARVLAELRYGGSMEKLFEVWLRAHRDTGW